MKFIFLVQKQAVCVSEQELLWILAGLMPVQKKAFSRCEKRNHMIFVKQKHVKKSFKSAEFTVL